MYFAAQTIRQPIPRSLNRVPISDLPDDLGTLTFHDPTLPPGSCVVMIEAVELDSNEARIVVNKKTKILPLA